MCALIPMLRIFMMSKAMLFLYLCYWVWPRRLSGAVLELRRSVVDSRARFPSPKSRTTSAFFAALSFQLRFGAESAVD